MKGFLLMYIYIYIYIYILTNIMNRRSISGNNTEQVLQSQITNLQSNIIISGTNLGVGPNALNQVTTRMGNTAVGSDAGGAPYGVAAGSWNVMVGANAGNICSGGSNNTILGSNTDFTPRVGYYSGSIALGSGAIINNYNQQNGSLQCHCLQYGRPGHVNRYQRRYHFGI